MIIKGLCNFVPEVEPWILLFDWLLIFYVVLLFIIDPRFFKYEVVELCFSFFSLQCSQLVSCLYMIIVLKNQNKSHNQWLLCLESVKVIKIPVQTPRVILLQMFYFLIIFRWKSWFSVFAKSFSMSKLIFGSFVVHQSKRIL